MARLISLGWIMLAVVFLAASSAPAEDVWTGYRSIEKLDVQDNYAIVWHEGTDGCDRNYKLNFTGSLGGNYREKLTLLMGAFFGGYEVNIKYREELGPCDAPIIKVRTRR